MWPFKKSRRAIPSHNENAEGDFYVENQSCLNCGAPQAEAPDLIDHSKKDYGHCFFKKQPHTEAEIEQAINAIAVSCVSALRYGGKDEKILKRLYEIGEGKQCDYKPIGNYKLLVWNRVTFKYDAPIQGLYRSIIEQTALINFYLNNTITNFKSNDKNYFEFTYRWTEGLTGIIYKCHCLTDNSYEILLYKESDAYLVAIRGNAIKLKSILSNNKDVNEMKWYDMDGISYDPSEIK